MDGTAVGTDGMPVRVKVRELPHPSKTSSGGAPSNWSIGATRPFTILHDNAALSLGNGHRQGAEAQRNTLGTSIRASAQRNRVSSLDQPIAGQHYPLEGNRRERPM